MPPRYCCYLLRSGSSRRTYIGITNNLSRRIRMHNGEIKGGAKYTRLGRPWFVAAFVSGFRTQRETLMFEWAWKHWKRRGGPAGLARRREGLRAVVSRERWTKQSPAAADVPLRVHWLPEGGEPLATASSISRG